MTPSDRAPHTWPIKGMTVMIRHTVTFKLKHAPGSPEETDFLNAGRALAEIPVVRNFECLRQISNKNPHDFGFSMEFESVEDFGVYNAHPDHVAFVQSRWISEVTDFRETDYVPYDCG